MRQLKLGYLALATAALFGWALLSSKCYSFRNRALDYLADTSSIDATNDLAYANEFLVSAGLGFVTCFALSIRATLQPTRLCLPALSGLLLVAAWLHTTGDPRPIVLFPIVDMRLAHGTVGLCFLIAVAPLVRRVRPTLFTSSS